MTIAEMGASGFRWFIGVVEDRQDPLMLGRCRVRIYNVHSDDKTMMPTDGLPWAVPVTPLISASNQKVGLSPNGPTLGTIVFGFFADGAEAQMPVMLGTLPGIPENKKEKHDVPEPAREINSVKKEPLGPEPSSPYAAKYPYNKVFRSESGHVIEVDDTPGAERLHVYHRTGTYTETNHEGRFVRKVVNDDYEIVAKDQTVYVGGNVKVIVKGNVDIRVNGTYTVIADKPMTFIAPRIDLNPEE